jgi:hypothetical protein
MCSIAHDGTFRIRPMVREAASVRAIFILKAADLPVDEEWAAEVVSRPIGFFGKVREVLGGALGQESTLEARLEEPLETAVAWGRPRLTRARLLWNHLSLPFNLELVRPATHQRFVIPTTEGDLDPPLLSLPDFAGHAGSGRFRWSSSKQRWMLDDDRGTGAGVPSPLTPHDDPPLRAAEAEPRDGD